MSRIGWVALFLMLVAPLGCATMNPGGTPGATGTTGTTPPETAAPPAPTQVSGSESGTIPVGQQLDVRLQTELSSETAQVEQRFEATTAADLMQDGQVLVPAGSAVRGVVRSVDKAGRVDRTGRLTLAFDQIEIKGREYPMRAIATQVYESGGIRDEVGTAGAGAGAGAVVGGLLGGLRGALIGAIVGAGGVIAATEGADVTIPAGSIIRVRLDTPVQVR
jgi:hypothetical protein